MDSAPHILSNPQQQWVVEKTANSIFSIISTPRGEKFPNDKVAKEKYVAILSRLHTGGKNQSRHWSAWEKKWSKLKKVTATATAFAFQKPEKGHLILLTSAHLIKEMYLKKYGLTKPDIASLNKAYCFDVSCVHTAREFQISPEDDNADLYVSATLVAIDSSLDIMALTVCEQDLARRCTASHCTINGIADEMPPRGELILLQGWPHGKFDTSAWGHMSTARGYNWITSENPHGYRMKVSEIPLLDCEDGCSGGPLVNGKLQCAGLYHGTLDYCGYVVHISHIRQFLIDNDLMVDLAAAAAAAAGHVVNKDGPDQDQAGDEKGAKRRRTGKMAVEGEGEEDDEKEDWSPGEGNQRR